MAQDPSRNRKSLRSAELFAGAGGLALGVHRAGFEGVFLNEWDERAFETLTANPLGGFDQEPEVVPGPVQEISFDDLSVDLVAGGPPCQPFSLGGDHRGQSDHRNMFPEFARALREIRPRAFVCENVKGLLRTSFRPFFDYVIDELSNPVIAPEEGEAWESHHGRLVAAKPDSSCLSNEYEVRFWLLNAADYGVPQIRERVFIIGIRKDLGIVPSQPPPTHSGEALRRSIMRGTYWERHAMKARDVINLRRVKGGDPLLEPWLTLRDAIGDMPEPIEYEEHPDFSHHVGWPGAREYRGHTPNDLDLPSKTIKAGVHGVPGGEHILRQDDGRIRYYTVRETARIMTFPDSWVFCGPRGEQMRQLGNAVPVRLAEAVATHVRDLLAGTAEGEQPVPREPTQGSLYESVAA